jgi:hypothetical protein
MRFDFFATVVREAGATIIDVGMQDSTRGEFVQLVNNVPFGFPLFVESEN